MSYSYQVPLSYTISVSLASTPSGLSNFNTNSIAIFSNEAAGFSESYQAYISPNAVKTDFGSDSLTYKMAKALFTPVPNFRTGGGYLYIFPFNGTNATSGTFTTANISANVSNFAAVTDGALKITIDGTATTVSGMNFSSVTSLGDIVKVLQSQNLDVDIAVDGNTIVFTSRKYGTNSTIAISTVSSGTDISGSTLLNSAAGTAVAGTASSGQTLAEAVEAALEQVYFGGILSTQTVDDTVYLANSTAIQSLDCTYYEVIRSLKDISGVGASIQLAGNGKTRTLAYSMEGAKQAVATYASIAKSTNYNGSNTAKTLNLKTLTGILPDKNLNDTYVLAANTYGVDIYGNTGGLSVVYSNDNNGYTDVIDGNLWIKKTVEVALFNALRQTNTKIPQTEAGVALLKNAVAQVCEQSVTNGLCAPGTWNSAETFGDVETFKRNIEEKGYYIYSSPIALQSQADREDRKCPLIQVAIKLAGAIHFCECIITVEP